MVLSPSYKIGTTLCYKRIVTLVRFAFEIVYCNIVSIPKNYYFYMKENENGITAL